MKFTNKGESLKVTEEVDVWWRFQKTIKNREAKSRILPLILIGDQEKGLGQ